jgi:RNA polymerase primary sigma factor
MALELLISDVMKQDKLSLERVKDRMEVTLGRPVTDEEWAANAGCSVEDLHERIREGTVSRQKMLVSNLRLVVSVAKRYQTPGMSFLDLCQEGMLGLLKGADRFDYSKGYKFSTYAYWWIRQAITRGIASDSRMIRLPMRTVECLYKIKRTSKAFFLATNREPNLAELAANCGMPEDKVRIILNGAQPLVSMDACTTVESRPGYEWRNVTELTDERKGPDDVVDIAMMREDVQVMLESLRPREREVLRMRYGLNDTGRIWTLEEVGKMFSVTRERIRQIEVEALRKLRKRCGYLWDYIQ